MRREVEFSSEGTTVRGWLYTPDEGEGPYPVIVMAGGWCYVKELVQPHYAEMYAEAGFAALLFDYRNFGSSDGDRRQHIDPNMQIADYRNAISYAETLDEVDSDRIGVWGLSYSGGHALILGATDPRVKCVASQIPVVDGYRNMRRVHGTRLPGPAARGSPPSLRHRRGRLPPARRAGSHHGGVHVALPGDLHDLHRAQGLRGPGV
jgi:cephalosporin-C deacetylase-like acetyl esterase